MKPINFYPGPSAIYPSIEKHLVEAFRSGILEQNHRSTVFMNMLKETIEILKEKLNIPASYHVFFTASATECWEIVAQSCLCGDGTFANNGAFGAKWANYAQSIYKNGIIEESCFDINQNINTLKLSEGFNCLVSNETSNGTQLSNTEIGNIAGFKCVDATSDMAGVAHDFAAADIWLASSQKCFGLPSGLGILVVSEKAMHKATEINERLHYNSLLFIAENFAKFQTQNTPNIMAIYLMGKVMHEIENIKIIDQKIRNRANELYLRLAEFDCLELLISNPAVRSATVLAIKSNVVAKIKVKMLENNILIGNGYGKWSSDTFRIANFPAIPDHHYEKLITVLKTI